MGETLQERYAFRYPKVKYAADGYQDDSPGRSGSLSDFCSVKYSFPGACNDGAIFLAHVYTSSSGAHPPDRAMVELVAFCCTASSTGSPLTQRAGASVPLRDSWPLGAAFAARLAAKTMEAKKERYILTNYPSG